MLERYLVWEKGLSLAAMQTGCLLPQNLRWAWGVRVEPASSVRRGALSALDLHPTHLPTPHIGCGLSHLNGLARTAFHTTSTSGNILSISLFAGWGDL